jgi:hypothetical protein
MAPASGGFLPINTQGIPMNDKKLAGKVILEHDSLNLNLEDDIIEYRKSMEPDILRQVHDTAYQASQNDLYKNKDFYVVLITTIDRVLRMPKIIPLARRSCPTPVYKQSVWKYNNVSGSLDFLWSIPDSILYNHIVNNPKKYLTDKECADLAKFVILMESGELLEWVKKENGEKIDAVIKIQEESACLAS